MWASGRIGKHLGREARLRQAGRCGRGGRAHQFHVVKVGPFAGVGVGAEPDFALPVRDRDARNLYLHPVEGSGEGASYFGCAEAAGVELALRLAAAAFRCVVLRRGGVFLGWNFARIYGISTPRQRPHNGGNTARYPTPPAKPTRLSHALPHQPEDGSQMAQAPRRAGCAHGPGTGFNGAQRRARGHRRGLSSAHALGPG